MFYILTSIEPKKTHDKEAFTYVGQFATLLHVYTFVGIKEGDMSSIKDPLYVMGFCAIQTFENTTTNTKCLLNEQLLHNSSLFHIQLFLSTTTSSELVKLSFLQHKNI